MANEPSVSRARRGALALLLTAAAVASALACSAETLPQQIDAGAPVGDASEAPDAARPADASAPGADAGPDASSAGADAGAACTFNADCPTAERCECDEATGCFCFPGARGTGKAGVDACKDGNDCETALCVEGNGGTFYCSGPCTGPSECGPNLPRCSYIQLLGDICIREPAKDAG